MLLRCAAWLAACTGLLPAQADDAAAVLRKAKEIMARAQMQSLKVAIWSYRTEYNRLPKLGTEDEKTPVESKGLLLDILTGGAPEINPRRIQFYEPVKSKDGKTGGAVTDASGGTEVRDPWGRPYRLHLDWDGDGAVPDPERPSATVPEVVMVYSAGPDGDYSTWADNVATWK